jgi:hypothetical protein
VRGSVKQSRDRFRFSARERLLWQDNLARIAQCLVVVQLKNTRPVRPCEHQRIEIAIFSSGGAAEVIKRAGDRWPAQLPQALMRIVLRGGKYGIEVGACRRILAAIATPSRRSLLQSQACPASVTASSSPKWAKPTHTALNGKDIRPPDHWW